LRVLDIKREAYAVESSLSTGVWLREPPLIDESEILDAEAEAGAGAAEGSASGSCKVKRGFEPGLRRGAWAIEDGSKFVGAVNSACLDGGLGREEDCASVAKDEISGLTSLSSRDKILNCVVQRYWPEGHLESINFWYHDETTLQQGHLGESACFVRLSV